MFMKLSGMCLLATFFCSIKIFSSNQDGLQSYLSFVQHMNRVEPNDRGNQELCYTIEREIKGKIKFLAFKGFRVTREGAVHISRDLDAAKFDQDRDKPALEFYQHLMVVFQKTQSYDSNLDHLLSEDTWRRQIQLPEGEVIEFFPQFKNKMFIGKRLTDKDRELYKKTDNC